MFNLIKNKFSSMEVKTKKILKYGMLFSLFVCFLAIVILYTYHFHTNPDLYYIGLQVFKMSIFFAVDFIICAFAIDTIKSQIC